ncbi:MAG: bifunctional diaminohydroxyphosphoribosylaminopyrimidine deaminase/5-amino-6-(5-phosphoribosylamino)uracil reductase RibD [Flavobacteriales bacterium]
MKTKENYIKRCLELAVKGVALAMPNPSVGAVLVHEGKIIGEGFTSPFGGSHGEVNCLNSVSLNDRNNISKSTLYVSLEPCSHTGKTPPCANLIIENKIPEVVIGCVDTFSLVAGKGIKMLKEKGIKVTVGVLEQECRESNKRFFTFHEQKRPFVVLKWAQTSDKFIAPNKEYHKEERWITGSLTKELVHKLRSEEMAILVGKNTVLADDPSLTTRNFPGKNPVRVVIDRKLELWNRREDFVVFDNEVKTIIINSESDFEEGIHQGLQVEFDLNFIDNLLAKLHKLGIQSVLVEGGAKTLQAFVDSGKWDEAYVFENEKKFRNGVKAPHFQASVSSSILVGNDSLSVFKNHAL